MSLTVRRALGSAALIVVGLGAAPPVDTTEHTVSFGGGRYARYDGTPTVRTDLRELVVFGEVRHRLDGGLVVAGSLAVAPALTVGLEQLSPANAVDYDAPSSELGEFTFGAQGAARVGKHTDHFGGEIGAALVREGAWLALGPVGPSAVA